MAVVRFGVFVVRTGSVDLREVVVGSRTHRLAGVEERRRIAGVVGRCRCSWGGRRLIVGGGTLMLRGGLRSRGGL